MLGVEVVYPDAAPDPLGARPPAPGLARRLRAAAFERGLLVELGGHHGSVLRLLPPLTITDAEADQVIGILTDALAQLSRDPRP
jgi:diaminobutyrate-2-oxoglutarate transaminase